MTPDPIHSGGTSFSYDVNQKIDLVIIFTIITKKLSKKLSKNKMTKQIKTNEDLREAVSLFGNNNNPYGPIEYWDTSNVQNMIGMFYNCIKFNQPLYLNITKVQI